ncbi:MAG: hypothetical protein KJ630_19260 [Proteobacteria bacterium]|nr:hypothetical protein [Pseudomonadota bacterium]
MRRTFQLSKRHDAILLLMSTKIGVNKTETIQRALEALEEKEKKRELEIGKVD